MISYRDVSCAAAPRLLLEELRQAADKGDTTDLLLGAGELEQAVLDALHPARDGWSRTAELLRDLSIAAGAACLQARAGERPDCQLKAVLAALERLGPLPLPASVEIKAPEGYFHYALDPAAYAAAATTYLDTVGPDRSRHAVVIGVRSIGTSLSAIVAAVLGTRRTMTLRPRGNTGARHIAVDAAFKRKLHDWLAADCDILIVDEGPGATGETFHCVAQWLRHLGVLDGRIALVPSHTGGMAMAPAERRAWFAGMRKYPPPNDHDRVPRLAAQFGLVSLEDLSAGAWRNAVAGAEEQPASIGHERLKYRGRDAKGEHWLMRYVGLGRWGAAVRDRAVLLAESGLGPALYGASDGFLVCRWAQGCPALPGANAERRLFHAALRQYLAGRAGLFRTGHVVNHEPLRAMLVENACEALGSEPAGLATAMRRLESLPVMESSVTDARLQAWEWVRTSGGYLKVDAIEHGDGLRLPGPVHVAWDVAGAAVEYDLSPAALDDLTDAVAAATGEPARHLAMIVAAYRAPYAASALGHAALAAREASEADSQRLLAEVARYRAGLQLTLAVL